MWIQIEHSLVFEYSDFVSESRMELRIEPRSTPHQTIRSFALAVGPATRVHRYADWNGNHVHHFGIANYHERIEVVGNALVETHPQPIYLQGVTDRPVERADLGQLIGWTTFDGPIVHSPALVEFANGLSSDPKGPIGEQILETGNLIRSRIAYEAGVTNYKSTTDHLIEERAGVCQDFAHLQMALLRMRGIPARYVSGYLHLGTGETAESHAWIEVHAGEHGWIAFDPTHSCVPDERYICVGWGRDYDDVAPNRGVYRGNAEERLTATVRTFECEPQKIVDRHEAVSQIDVPVFRSMPVRTPGAARVGGKRSEPLKPGQQ